MLNFPHSAMLEQRGTVSEALVAYPDVAKIAFAGSEQGGAHINQRAGRDFKLATMELGGKSANFVFNDAGFENVVMGIVSGIFAASGQTCVAGSRSLVQRGLYDRLIERLVEFAGTARLGNPVETSTQVGPVTTPPQYVKILDYIQIAKVEGAELRLVGGPATAPGCSEGQFEQPTIFSGITNDMCLAREEVFGPVLACIPFGDEDDAIGIANDSPYGLAAGVWTSGFGRMLRMSNVLHVGMVWTMVWTNACRAVSYKAPFGVIQRSGLGREIGSEPFHEHSQSKTVWLSAANDVPDPFVIR